MSNYPDGCDSRYVVVVTYGTRPWMAYATTTSKHSADILAGKAWGLGYRAPKVMTQREFFERDVPWNKMPAAGYQPGSRTSPLRAGEHVHIKS